MKKVNIWYCERCGLKFVADELPKMCPSCRRNYSGTVTFHLAGRDVEVASVRLYGDSPLKDKAVTRGLGSMRLGDRCPHGFISSLLCPNCQ